MLQSRSFSLPRSCTGKTAPSLAPSCKKRFSRRFPAAPGLPRANPGTARPAPEGRKHAGLCRSVHGLPYHQVKASGACGVLSARHRGSAGTDETHPGTRGCPEHTGAFRERGSRIPRPLPEGRPAPQTGGQPEGRYTGDPEYVSVDEGRAGAADTPEGPQRTERNGGRGKQVGTPGKARKGRMREPPQTGGKTQQHEEV